MQVESWSEAVEVELEGSGERCLIRTSCDVTPFKDLHCHRPETSIFYCADPYPGQKVRCGGESNAVVFSGKRLCCNA